MIAVGSAQVSSLAHASPRGVKRSRSPELHVDQFGVDRVDEGKQKDTFWVIETQLTFSTSQMTQSRENAVVRRKQRSLKVLSLRISPFLDPLPPR